MLNVLYKYTNDCYTYIYRYVCVCVQTIEGWLNSALQSMLTL